VDEDFKEIFDYFMDADRFTNEEIDLFLKRVGAMREISDEITE
jgi:hypothetical protein